MQRIDASDWLQTSRSRRTPKLFEQSLIQANDFAMILLLAEVDPDADEFDPDADRTAKQRLQARLHRE
jgi:hypothetical protein